MSNIILRVSGTFGSGKTTAVREFINRYPSEVLKLSTKIMGYRVDLSSQGVTQPLYIVGKYDNVCGGTDSIKDQATVADRIMKAHALGHVMYEGALVSASGLGGKVTQTTEPTGCTVYAFLDTPEDKCIRRVIQRRLNAGNEKEFDPKNLIQKFRSVWKCSENLLEADCNVEYVDHLYAHDHLLKLITEY